MCHLGVLKALKENNIEVYCVAGSSMGAMAGGLFAAGILLEDIEEIALSVKQSFIMDLNVDIRHRQGLFSIRRVTKLLENTLGDLLIEECPIKYCATAVDVETGELTVFHKGVLRDAIRASIAIPALFVPWQIDGRTYIDGGVLCRLPIESAREMGADAVIAVDALGPIRTSPIPKNVVGMLQRYYNITDWEIIKNKLNTADLVITPEMNDKSEFVFKGNDEAIEAGYKAAIDAMPKIIELVK